MRTLLAFCFLTIVTPNPVWAQGDGDSPCFNHFILQSLLSKTRNEVLNAKALQGTIADRTTPVLPFQLEGEDITLDAEQRVFMNGDVLVLYSRGDTLAAFRFYSSDTCQTYLWEQLDYYLENRNANTLIKPARAGVSAVIYTKGKDNQGMAFIAGYREGICKSILDAQRSARLRVGQLIDQARNATNQGKWATAIQVYTQLMGIDQARSDEFRNEISKVRNRATESYVQKAEKSIRQGLLLEADSYYREALEIDPDNLQLSQLALRNRRAYLGPRTTPLLRAADSCKVRKNWECSKSFYERVLAIDPSDTVVMNNLNQIENTLSEINSRDTAVFDYATLFPKEYSVCTEAYRKLLFDFIQKSNQGEVNDKVMLAFDREGKNRSVVPTSGTRENKSLYEAWQKEKSIMRLPSSKIVTELDTLYTASRTEFLLRASWKTRAYSFSFDKGSDNHCNRKAQTGINSPTFSSTVRKDGTDNATYMCTALKKRVEDFGCSKGIIHYQIKYIQTDGDSSQTVSLTRFSKRNGAWCTVYSMIMPGWGTRKVYTSKSRAGLTFLSFIAFAGLSAYSKYQSDVYYDRYLNAQQDAEQAFMEKQYDQANLYNKIFLGAGAIACGIYVTDIVRVFQKGIKNGNQARRLNRELDAEPYVVFSSSLNSINR